MNSNVDSLIEGHIAEFNKSLDKAILGNTECVPQSSPPLTYGHLKALHDYLKPETLTIAGEGHEIYGYNVHTLFCPQGITVLTEKDDPTKPPRRACGKLVIINEENQQAMIYDPSSPPDAL